MKKPDVYEAFQAIAGIASASTEAIDHGWQDFQSGGLKIMARHCGEIQSALDEIKAKLAAEGITVETSDFRRTDVVP